MHLEIVTPEKTAFSGTIRSVQLPGASGSFQLKQNHAPIIATLAKGKVRVVAQQGDEQIFEIASGVVEAAANNIVVLVESV